MFLFAACAAPDDGDRPARDPAGDADVDTDADTDADSDADADPSGELGTLAQDGATTALDTHGTVNYRGVDAAWDDDAGVFLVVYGNAPIGGAFLDAAGTQQGSGFLVSGAEYDGSNWAQNPRVVAHGGGFLVSWHDEAGGPAVQVRRVRWDGGPALGDVHTVSDGGTQQESPAALAYSTGTGEHLVVWAREGLWARRLDRDGSPVADMVSLTTPGTWVEMPAAAYQPDCACFVVTVMQARDDGAHVLLLRVAEDGALIGDAVDLTGAIEFAKVTDVEIDHVTGEAIATWYEVKGGVAGFAAQRFDAAGASTGAATTVFAPYGSYDGYDLGFSDVTGTSLGAFHGTASAAVAGELDRALAGGAPLDLDAGGAVDGFYLPRVAALPDEEGWLVLGSPDYARVAVARVVRR
ncbi:MAG: hypothetical protein ACOZNI_08520 [Myxococcota bacterium]